MASKIKMLLTNDCIKAVCYWLLCQFLHLSIYNNFECFVLAVWNNWHFSGLQMTKMHLLCFRYISESSFLLGALHSRSKFANCLDLTLLLLSTTCPVLANCVDPDQLASEEANWSGSALFVIQYVNLYQQPGSGSDWLKIRSGHGILIYSAWEGLMQNHLS